MKIKARTTGDVIEINDEGAGTLIDAGIYDAVTEPTKKEPPKAPAPKTPAPEKPTKVEPLTTEDMPSTKKTK